MHNRGVSLVQSQQIIERALVLSEKQSLSPLVIVVLDNGGHIKAIASEDNAGTQRVEIAKGKANAALGMGFDTSQFQQLINQGVLPEMFANCINGAANGGFIPLAGGVLIRKQQQIIGAIGISGASSAVDEQIAKEAIKVLRHKP